MTLKGLVGGMHCRQGQSPTISILNVCREHEDHENKPEYVNENVPLPALDLLPGVIAARFPHLRRLRGLAVNDRSCGLWSSSRSLPYPTTKFVVDALPSPVIVPSAKVTVDQLPRWEVVGQHAPLAAGTIYVEDGVNDLAPRMLGRRRSRLWRRDQRFQNFPLFVGEVGRVGFRVRTRAPTKLNSSKHRPYHQQQHQQHQHPCHRPHIGEQRPRLRWQPLLHSRSRLAPARRVRVVPMSPRQYGPMRVPKHRSHILFWSSCCSDFK